MAYWEPAANQVDLREFHGHLLPCDGGVVAMPFVVTHLAKPPHAQRFVVVVVMGLDLGPTILHRPRFAALFARRPAIDRPIFDSGLNQVVHICVR